MTKCLLFFKQNIFIRSRLKYQWASIEFFLGGGVFCQQRDPFDPNGSGVTLSSEVMVVVVFWCDILNKCQKNALRSLVYSRSLTFALYTPTFCSTGLVEFLFGISCFCFSNRWFGVADELLSALRVHWELQHHHVSAVATAHQRYLRLLQCPHTQDQCVRMRGLYIRWFVLYSVFEWCLPE